MSKRSGFSALIPTLLLAGLLVVLGVCGASQVSSTRRALAKAEARRKLELASRGAIEEASARLEANPPLAQQGRPVRARYALGVALADAKAQGVQLDSVIATTSGLVWDRDGSAVGIVEMRVKAAPVRSGPPAWRTFTVRRQFRVRGGSKGPVVTVASRDLFREEIEG